MGPRERQLRELDDYDLEEALKIYVLPVSDKFKPERQNFTSPLHNRQWGVEQDFEAWLAKSEHSTDDPQSAEWDYLPMYWNRMYINWNWGQDRLEDIQDEIFRLVSRNRPTFTICEYDLVQMQPVFDLCNMRVFTASRRAKDSGPDIPLLCSLHETEDEPKHDRRWLASFVGNVNAFSPRPEMAAELRGRNDVLIEHANHGTGFFVSLMRDSYLALCPRGHGGQSFRFYEAMQLGTVPLLIGDLDTRPFKRWLPWDRVSLYRPSVEGLSEYLDGLGLDRGELVAMGRRARDMYYHCLQYGQWPRYIVKELG